MVGVVRYEEQPIGLLILEFDARRYFDKRLVRDTLERALGEIAKPVRFLFQRRTQELIVNPIFRARETRVDPKLVFVLMPFTEQWSDRIWRKVIRPAVEQKGLEVIRADDLFGRDIMEDVWGSILRAACVVADITGRNANVFYELGIAHTVGRPVVLLTQAVEDIPFDLNRYRHIVYEDNVDGCELLANTLSKTLDELVSHT